MKICIVSKADSFGGGASKIAQELAFELKTQGHDVIHLARSTGGGFNEITQPLYGSFEKLIKKIHWHVRSWGFPELLPLELPRLLLKKAYRDVDVFHFHDLSAAISPFTLYVLSKFKPVVWTLHDLSCITGGCIQPVDCKSYKKGCGNCPQINMWPLLTKRDYTSFLFKVKSIVINSNVKLVSPSQWLAEEVKSVFNKHVAIVSNGVDQQVFLPQEKTQVLNKLGITSTKPIIVICSASIENRLKGFEHVLYTLSQLDPSEFSLLVVGKTTQAVHDALNDFDCRYCGFINSDELANYFNAADLLLYCPNADNQPLVVIEAASCGLPVFGFDVGGVKECLPQKVRDGLVPPNQRHLLPDKIKDFLQQPKRIMPEAEYSLVSMAHRYVAQYQIAIDEKRK